MLDQIVPSGSVRPDIRDQLAHYVQLVVTREDQAPPCHGLGLAGCVLFLLLPYFKADELLDDIHHTILIQDVLPDI